MPSTAATHNKDLICCALIDKGKTARSRRGCSLFRKRVQIELLFSFHPCVGSFSFRFSALFASGHAIAVP